MKGTVNPRLETSIENSVPCEEMCVTWRQSTGFNGVGNRHSALRCVASQAGDRLSADDQIEFLHGDYIGGALSNRKGGTSSSSRLHHPAVSDVHDRSYLRDGGKLVRPIQPMT